MRSGATTCTSRAPIASSTMSGTPPLRATLRPGQPQGQDERPEHAAARPERFVALMVTEEDDEDDDDDGDVQKKKKKKTDASASPS